MYIRIIKQLSDLVFVISRIIKVLASVSASADNTYLDLDYSGYQKNFIHLLFIIVNYCSHSNLSLPSLTTFVCRVKVPLIHGFCL